VAAMVPPVMLAVAVLLFLVWPAPLVRIASGLMDSNPRMSPAFGTPSALAGLLWTNAARFALFALAASILIAAAYLRQWPARAARVFAACALLLMIVDLGQATFPFNTQSDPAILEQRPAVIARMQEDTDLFRIGRYGPDKVLYSNLPTLYGLQDYGGYDSIILSDYADFVGAIESHRLLIYNIIMTFETPEALDSPLLPLLNIRYLLTTRRIEHADWESVPVEGNVHLYRVRPERELPRAFLVLDVRAAESVPEAIRILKSGEVDLKTTAVVESWADHQREPGDRTSGVSPPLHFSTSPSSSPGTVEMLAYRPCSIRLRTTAPEPGFLVLLDVFYPGWNVYVDGAPADLRRTNAVFRGVAVPAGTHEIEFRFQPDPFRNGLIAALATLLLLAVGGLYLRFSTSPAPAPKPGPTAPPLDLEPSSDNNTCG
jgi:hypothetical protein